MWKLKTIYAWLLEQNNRVPTHVLKEPWLNNASKHFRLWILILISFSSALTQRLTIMLYLHLRHITKFTLIPTYLL